ncbi:MAG: hypothetical protein KatS3mg026_0101 [Bacteroidia bacterium]|nr:MAG: hypothetical protein KatS3mg026_0101 [Bacteroidia bacterium]
MRRLFLLLVGLLPAQETWLQRVERLLAAAEEAPDHQVEALAHQALALFPAQVFPISDSLVALHAGSALDLLAYGLAHRGQVDSALFWCDSAYKLLSRFGHHKKAASVKANLAYYYHQKGRIIDAIQAHREIIALASGQGDLNLLYYTLNNLGGLFSEIGLQDSAAELYRQALLVADSLKAPRQKAITLNNLAVLYETQNLYAYARKYALEALQLRLALGDSANLPNTLSGLGRLHHHEGHLDSAYFYYRRAFEVARAVNNVGALATAATNLGSFFIQLAQPDSAAHYLNLALALREKSTPNERFKAYKSQVELYALLARKNPHRKEFLHQAYFWAQKAESLLATSKQVYDLDAIQIFYEKAHSLYATLGLWDKAYEAQNRYYLYRDSLTNQRTLRKALETRYQYEWQKHEQALQAEMLRQQIQAEEKQKRQRLWVGFLATLSLLLAGGGLVLWGLYQKTRQQRDLITYQKAELEKSHARISEQHTELMQSLRYARRIQQALLPDKTTLDLLPFSHALWFQPLTEVGGDFYYVRRLRETEVLVVLGDCTGHGVPGGFMTVLAISLLERMLETEGPFDLPQRLQALQAGFLHILHAERQDSVQDGMEASFAQIDLAQQELVIVTAGHYAWWLQRGSLHTIPPTGPGMGQGLRETLPSWATRKISFAGGGRLVLATDGARDQLGPSYRKWGRKKWEEALLSTAALPPDQALQAIREAWEAFRQGSPQIDDIAVWIIDLPPRHEIA